LTRTAPGSGSSGGGRPTDLKRLSSAERKSKLLQAVLNNPLWIFGLLRTIAPVLRIPGTRWVVVTRFDHVKQVLAANHAFHVPWAQKVRLLNDGKAPFLLGVDNSTEHREFLKLLMEVFRREDLPRVAALAESEATKILDGHVRTGVGNDFDAISDLITRVPVRICRDYYGIPIARHEEDAVIEWALGMSAYMFGDPNDDPKYAEVGLAAGAAIRPLLDKAIAMARARKAGDTIIDRFVAMHSADPRITDDVIRANLLGMVTGFVPTNTMASGHMLDAVVGTGRFLSWQRSMFMGPVKKALAARDDKRFFRCLMETLRFRPINPGPFRICVEDYTIDDGGFLGRGPKTIPNGAKVLASTQSAMFDGRRMEKGRKFNVDRASSEYMHFGSALHICVGAFLAEAQITPTLRALLTRKGLRRAKGGAGKLKRAGPFPAHLKVQFDG